MPTYLFKCEKKECDGEVSKTQKYTDPSPPCPKCKKETKRAIASSTFILKGAGWFNTGGY